MCKNWEMYGKCKFGDEVSAILYLCYPSFFVSYFLKCSFAHSREQLMNKTDVSVLYKTKLCKKFSTTGYCPYGIRCQFIHDVAEAPKKVLPQKFQSMVSPFVPSKASVPSVSAQKIKTVEKVPQKQQQEGQTMSAANNTQSENLVCGPVFKKQVQIQKPKFRQIFLHNIHVSIQEL
jgi:butyrate response factor 1